MKTTYNQLKREYIAYKTIQLYNHYKKQKYNNKTKEKIKQEIKKILQQSQDTETTQEIQHYTNYLLSRHHDIYLAVTDQYYEGIKYNLILQSEQFRNDEPKDL